MAIVGRVAEAFSDPMRFPRGLSVVQIVMDRPMCVDAAMTVSEPSDSWETVHSIGLSGWI
jgi:hypothetical protein